MTSKTEQEPPAYTRHFWAKWDRDNPGRIHLLEHHLADVGACFEALLNQPTIRRRLARTAGLDDLKEVTCSRLAVFAALHDIGKVNLGFQTRHWTADDLGDARRPQWGSHTSDLVPVLNEQWFPDAIGWGQDFDRWDDDGVTALAMFAAALSHHGRPVDFFDSRPPDPRMWRALGGLDPRVYIEWVGQLVRDWFPNAFNDGPPLPSSPEFQHMFLGLLTLADWIGSDECRFAYVGQPDSDYIATARERAARAVEQIGLDIEEQRTLTGPVPEFSDLFGIEGSPRAVQTAVAEVDLHEPLLIVESETGSGKTEAALWRFATMYDEGLVDGLYFALPTRAAAIQIYRRVNTFIGRMFPHHRAPAPVLAVPGYVRAGDLEGRHLPGYRVWWEVEPGRDDVGRRWAAEHVKRFLAAQIAVGTVDQAMLAALQVSHAHMRAACLSRNLLVVDEVHASDPYMGQIIEALLNTHLGAGGYAVLMSATLGSSARRRWLSRPRRKSARDDLSVDKAIDTHYPAVTTVGPDIELVREVGTNDRPKSVTFEVITSMTDLGTIAGRAIGAARDGAKVLVIRNTVDMAVRTQQAIEDTADPAYRNLLFAVNRTETLHHGRFAAEDRRMLDEAVEAQVGKLRAGGGRIVVGTQTLEQSLDIDADLLITDLCPMDVLLQRIGRLHRHDRDDRPDAYRQATCIVLTPSTCDLTPLLSSGRNANGLGPHAHVYLDLRILELTRRLVVENANSKTPIQIPEMNRELVESTTHPMALRSLVDEMGDAWVEHSSQLLGGEIAEVQIARQAVIQRDLTFLDEDVRFGSDEVRIRTRLGDEGVEVEFDPSPRSPFDREQQIAKLAVPFHLAGTSEPDSQITPVSASDGFEFGLGARRFAYDRLGLRRM